jgi:hypothetical protein
MAALCHQHLFISYIPWGLQGLQAALQKLKPPEGNLSMMHLLAIYEFCGFQPGQLQRLSCNLRKFKAERAQECAAMRMVLAATKVTQDVQVTEWIRPLCQINS